MRLYGCIDACRDRLMGHLQADVAPATASLSVDVMPLRSFCASFSTYPFSKYSPSVDPNLRSHASSTRSSHRITTREAAERLLPSFPFPPCPFPSPATPCVSRVVRPPCPQSGLLRPMRRAREEARRLGQTVRHSSTATALSRRACHVALHRRPHSAETALVHTARVAAKDWAGALGLWIEKDQPS
eukprot:4685099-Pleurochrysis_carterae.AAC.1